MTRNGYYQGSGTLLPRRNGGFFNMWGFTDFPAGLHFIVVHLLYPSGNTPSITTENLQCDDLCECAGEFLGQLFLVSLET